MLVKIHKDTDLLNSFLDDVDLTLKSAESEAEIVKRVSDSLTLLLDRRDREWLPDKFLRARSAKYSQYPLYIAPDGTFCVTALAFEPGASTGVHNHRVWGVVGVYRGLEDQTFYKRRPEGGLRFAGGMICEPGECSYLLPPEEEIHDVLNPTGDCSVSIHVYGADIARVPRQAYCLETGKTTTVFSRYEAV
jgi:predicted metal-dependent enzyme (double-stranded beta helix superfamily)